MRYLICGLSYLASVPRLASLMHRMHVRGDVRKCGRHPATPWRQHRVQHSIDDNRREGVDHQMPTDDVRVGCVHIRDAGVAGPVRVNVGARQFDWIAVCVHSNPPWQRYLIDR